MMILLWLPPWSPGGWFFRLPVILKIFLGVGAVGLDIIDGCVFVGPFWLDRFLSCVEDDGWFSAPFIGKEGVFGSFFLSSSLMVHGEI
jgi:hypothetical protein